ncbi:MAG: hypothetical protein NC311_18660, partial [Muribaculaceae bacterium]|nr:hypothetical protein [Muribaculaceae bacterium]
GLWHGAGWNYLVWGAMHGALYVATRFWLKALKPRLLRGAAEAAAGTAPGNEAAERNHAGGTGLAGRAGHIIMICVSRLLLFGYVSVAWVYFRAESVAQANQMLCAAVNGAVQRVSADLAACFQVDEFWYVLKVLHLDHLSYSRELLMWAFLAAGLYLAMVERNAAQRMERVKYRLGSAAAFAVLALWCVLTFSKVSTFLYFNF